MTPTEIDALRDFISHELRRVHEGQAELTARVEAMQEEQLGFQALVGRHFNDVLARLRRTEISLEQNRDLIQINAEGITTMDRRLEAFRAATAERFDRLDDRVDRLEVA